MMTIDQLKVWINTEVESRKGPFIGGWENGYIEALLDVLDKLT
jgi:hypothetical protein